MPEKKYIVMVGPSIRSQGGISTVVMSWQKAGLFERWPIVYLETHVEGSTLDKLRVGISAFLRVLLLLASNKVACVHLHVARRISFWRKSIFALAAFLFCRPVLLHLHSGGFPAFFHDECNWLQKRFIQLVLGQAEQLIVLSNVWRETLRQISDNQQITVIRNFIIPSLHAPDAEARDKHLFLFLGLLNRDKGFYDLLEAIEPLCKEYPALVLACGGKGEIGKVHERIRKLKVESHVKLLGWISDQSKEAWLSRASCLVLPSYVEGIPMAILEAMAWGLPIVSTKIGGIPDVIEQGVEGFLITPGDIVGLRDSMRRLLQKDEERVRMGIAAQQKFERAFSAKAIVPCIDSLYEQYCEKRIHLGNAYALQKDRDPNECKTN